MNTRPVRPTRGWRKRIGPAESSRTQTAMTAMFGGEGLSLATLEGDGQVILQSMTIEGLANAILKNAGIGDDKQGLLGGILSGSTE